MPTPTITWLSHGMDRKSVDGRWNIRHPKSCPSGRWELYDVKAGTWHGDWRTCSQAKSKAELVERVEAQSKSGLGVLGDG